MNERIVIHPPKKDSKGKFFITVSYYINGIRKQKRKTGFAKSSEAKAYGEKIKTNLEAVMPIIKATGTDTTTFEEFAKEYVKIKESEWAYNSMNIRNNAMDHCDFKSKPLIDINKMDLAKNVKRLEAAGYARNTVKSILESWKVFLNAAVEYDYLEKAPSYQIITAKEEVDQAVENVMSLEDAMKLLEKIKDPEIYLLTLIGITTGARVSEATDINVNDIDYETGIWKISHQYKYVKGKGYRHGQKLKTGNSNREVPIPPTTLRAIQTYPLRTIDGYIFDTKASSLGTRANATYKALGEEITFHGLRHTYVTNLIRSKQFDLQSIAKLAGDTIETITKTYIHYLEEMKQENIEKIKVLFG